jgi:hypothetical protein
MKVQEVILKAMADAPHTLLECPVFPKSGRGYGQEFLFPASTLCADRCRAVPRTPLEEARRRAALKLWAARDIP